MGDKSPKSNQKKSSQKQAQQSSADKQKVFEGNAYKVFPRLKAQMDKQKQKKK